METENNMAAVPQGRGLHHGLAFSLPSVASWHQQGWFSTVISSFCKVYVLSPSHSSELHCHPLTELF